VGIGKAEVLFRCCKKRRGEAGRVGSAANSMYVGFAAEAARRRRTRGGGLRYPTLAILQKKHRENFLEVDDESATSDKVSEL